MAVKYVRVGSRGTSRRIVTKEEDDANNWTGAPFREVMARRKEAAKDKYITTGRGTGSIRFGDLAPSAGRPSGKGMWVRTGRGTSKRKLE